MHFDNQYLKTKWFANNLGEVSTGNSSPIDEQQDRTIEEEEESNQDDNFDNNQGGGVVGQFSTQNNHNNLVSNQNCKTVCSS